LIGEEYMKTKGELGEDIHEGKISILVIHAMKNSQKNERL
jgi:geranylgeranyl pyrophosphate synthase